MPIEFLGIAATSDGSETNPRSGASFDKDYTVRLARAHEENGWDRVLFAYGSGAPDPAAAAAYIASQTETLQLLLAHRPNLSIPTYAAKTFATIDQISDGRVTVHFITGGNDHEQAREGDRLAKDDRYSRTREYIEIVKRVWTEHEPFDHAGQHYAFEDFVSDVFPVQQPRPGVSFGGSSPAAYETGAAVADIYCLWGEPLADTAEQIATIREAARAAGRETPPRIQVAFRPILGPTEDAAWAKAHDVVERIEHRKAGGTSPLVRRYRGAPENTGSQRLLRIADAGDRYDRAMWTATAKATGGAGNSNALVGTPETVAAALLDYVDLGVDILSARGYDLLDDAVEFGQQVIPIVREEVAKRDRRARCRVVTVVLWDVDGTLLRAGGAGARCFRDGLASMGRPWPEAKLDFGGRTDPEIARLLLDATHPDGAPPDPGAAAALLASVEAAYAERAAELAALTSALPNVRAAIAAVADAGAVQTIVTGNVCSVARHKLAAVGLDDVIDLSLGAFGDDDHVDRADLVRLALARVDAAGHSCDPPACWVVGDTPRDLTAARAAGVRCALVATGTFDGATLTALEPDLLLADLHDVATLLAAFSTS